MEIEQRVSKIAQEINNPPSAIKGGFMLIRSMIPKDHKCYKYLILIDKEIDRIAGIVKEMFNTSKL